MRVDDAAPDPAVEAWRGADLDAIEATWRDGFRDADAGAAVIWRFWADARSARDTEDRFVLGSAFHASSLVLYPDTIDRLRSRLPGPGLLEAEPEEVGAAHELGHLLGLANNGVGMVVDHPDEAHGNHDDNDACLMHGTIEGAGLFDALLDRTPTFDRACLDDLEAAGGRPAAEAREVLRQVASALAAAKRRRASARSAPSTNHAMAASPMALVPADATAALAAVPTPGSSFTSWRAS